MNKISLCVTSYNRPDTLRQLIHSYIRQDYSNKELIISDDTSSGKIKNLISEFEQEKTIKYFHNKPGLGFSKNLLESMKRASGKYIVLLGDDDVLLYSNVLSEYVKVFDKNPSVGFVYTNHIQFSGEMKIEYIINYFLENKLFKKGKEAMISMWMRSIFIGGIGIRNSNNITNFYPNKTILHPQVELLGNIVNISDAYIIAKNYIGFRSHEDQIIFKALKNRVVRQEGSHMTIELFEIFKKIRKIYVLDLSTDFLEKQLIKLQSIMFFKEKTILGTKEMEENYQRFCKLSSVAASSTKFKTMYLLAKMMPSSFISFARKSAFNYFSFIKRKEFIKFKMQLDYITSEKN